MTPDPLVAYLDRDDPAHAQVSICLDDFSGRLVTTSAGVISNHRVRPVNGGRSAMMPGAMSGRPEGDAPSRRCCCGSAGRRGVQSAGWPARRAMSAVRMRKWTVHIIPSRGAPCGVEWGVSDQPPQRTACGPDTVGGWVPVTSAACHSSLQDVCCVPATNGAQVDLSHGQAQRTGARSA